MELLAAIADTPSITAAAKKVGLSYKAAWDAIEAMNNLSDQPLVERSVGGKGGGGTRLTTRGAKLVATFGEIASENARFVERLNQRIAGAEPDLAIIGRLSMLTSARNHFVGKVVRITPGAVNDEVELKLSGGGRIVAVITHQSVQQLGLRKNAEAIALVKASSIIVAVESDSPMTLSARNQLAGTIARIVPGAVNTEVVIGLAGGNTVAAIITNASAKEMRLSEGSAVIAVFKASSVILAVNT
jgi:molybdate transport system regulatory protein